MSTNSPYHLRGKAIYIPDLGILLQRSHIQAVLKNSEETPHLRFMVQGFPPIDLPVRGELLNVHLQELFIWISGTQTPHHQEKTQVSANDIQNQQALEMILKASDSHTDTMAIFNRPPQKDISRNLDDDDTLQENDKKNIPPHLFDLS